MRHFLFPLVVGLTLVSSAQAADTPRTEHIYFATNSGGIETITARDPTDTQEIARIQQALQELVQQYQSGNFDGLDMERVQTLQPAGKKITYTYSPLKHGASIRYDSTDPKLVRAIHQWFTAATNDLRKTSP